MITLLMTCYSRDHRCYDLNYEKERNFNTYAMYYLYHNLPEGELLLVPAQIYEQYNV